MRLTELNPQWIMQRHKRVVGVRFQCPCCRETQICILFLNPPDGGPSQQNDETFCGNNWGNRWARSGLSFEDLTLSPSVDASSTGHWHGHLTNGEVITV